MTKEQLDSLRASLASNLKAKEALEKAGIEVPPSIVTAIQTAEDGLKSAETAIMAEKVNTILEANIKALSGIGIKPGNTIIIALEISANDKGEITTTAKASKKRSAIESTGTKTTAGKHNYQFDGKEFSSYAGIHKHLMALGKLPQKELVGVNSKKEIGAYINSGKMKADGFELPIEVETKVETAVATETAPATPPVPQKNEAK